MNFKEAKSELANNKRILDIHILHSKPPHRVLCSFVSGQNYPMDFHKSVFQAVHENRLDNEKHLNDLGIIDNQPLIPLVALLMWGNTVLVTLYDYISFRDSISG